jgi:hypothetical protein
MLAAVVGVVGVVVGTLLGKYLDRSSEERRWKRDQDADLERWIRVQEAERDQWLRDQRATVYAEFLGSASIHASDAASGVELTLPKVEIFGSTAVSERANDLRIQAWRLRKTTEGEERKEAFRLFWENYQDTVALIRQELRHTD